MEEPRYHVYKRKKGKGKKVRTTVEGNHRCGGKTQTIKRIEGFADQTINVRNARHIRATHFGLPLGGGRSPTFALVVEIRDAPTLARALQLPLRALRALVPPQRGDVGRERWVCRRWDVFNFGDEVVEALGKLPVQVGFVKTDS